MQPGANHAWLSMSLFIYFAGTGCVYPFFPASVGDVALLV